MTPDPPFPPCMRPSLQKTSWATSLPGRGGAKAPRSSQWRHRRAPSGAHRILAAPADALRIESRAAAAASTSAAEATAAAEVTITRHRRYRHHRHRSPPPTTPPLSLPPPPSNPTLTAPRCRAEAPSSATADAAPDTPDLALGLTTGTPASRTGWFACRSCECRVIIKYYRLLRCLIRLLFYTVCERGCACVMRP